ncbi:leucine-rich repeat transmembrane neuronal protein 3-like [Uranotaenia lowii]|uniref:leucine-rich repeat transmembrane neuronal protein 3-like n=1 Tax=Uranotaenia lowii TaxID=190385 RepID=UPI00247AD122|nr:leucine-rich repeat transmembrane neuronal protein 3-like [Uranotaenia lowii]
MIPEAINNLTKLQQLWLTDLELAQLDLSLFNNLPLQQFYINRMPVNLTASEMVSLESLEVLHIVDCNLTELDLSRWNSPVLRSLVLERNTLTSFPVGLKKFRTLTSINIGYNRLESLDFSLFKGLDHLEHLFLSHNHILRLIVAESILLSSLTSISLAHNRLMDVDQLMQLNLPALERLDLTGNNLERFEGLEQHSNSSLTNVWFEENPINCSWAMKFKSGQTKLNWLNQIRKLCPWIPFYKRFNQLDGVLNVK